MAISPHNPPLNASFNPKAFLGQAGPGKVLIKCKKKEDIFIQGDVAETIFYIQKGKVKVTVLSEQGKEAVVGILAQGQFFGEGCLDGAKLRTSTTRAMEECLLTSITKAMMIATLETEPKFSAYFMAYLLSRNSRIEDDLIDQLFNSSERRLARLLLLLADFGKEGGAQPIPVTISQEILADMIGTTRSRVSFFMNKFRKKGFISYNGKIEVHRSLLDAVLRDKPQIKEDE
ncbi:Crp/Fnr family transcriptional regulator [Bradyrhizobium sp. dw_78]|uniref:Crp/Fnr family transcriptional regulator n=1 Tax=Bradyrhizobium sp. dw_78 TaxID=2719793 RepID=UPI0032085026